MARGIKRLNIGKDLSAETLRELIGNMIAAGVSVAKIAKIVDIPEQTLRRGYLDDIEAEEHKKNARIVGKLYELCMAGDKQAIMFWCKTKLGWKEKSEVEVNGNLSSIQPVLNVTVNQITPKEFKALSGDKEPEECMATLGDGGSVEVLNPPDQYQSVSETGDSSTE